MAAPIVPSTLELSTLAAWYESRVQTALATWSGRQADRSRLAGLQARLAELTDALTEADPMPAAAPAPVVQGAGIMLPPGFTPPGR